MNRTIGCVTASVGYHDVFECEQAKSEFELLSKNPGEKDPLKAFFESKGFEVDWDRDSEYGAWHELYLDGEMVLQVQQGVSVKRFMNWFRDSKKDPGFMVAGPKEDFKKFCKQMRKK